MSVLEVIADDVSAQEKARRRNTLDALSTFFSQDISDDVLAWEDDGLGVLLNGVPGVLRRGMERGDRIQLVGKYETRTVERPSDLAEPLSSSRLTGIKHRLGDSNRRIRALPLALLFVVQVMAIFAITLSIPAGTASVFVVFTFYALLASAVSTFIAACYFFDKEDY